MDDSTENKAEIQAAVKTLLDEFTAVDNTLHGADDGKQYSEASESIDAAIETLKSNAK
jgi:DNA anti-recombination protein RmuC